MLFSAASLSVTLAAGAYLSHRPLGFNRWLLGAWIVLLALSLWPRPWAFIPALVSVPVGAVALGGLLAAVRRRQR